MYKMIKSIIGGLVRAFRSCQTEASLVMDARAPPPPPSTVLVFLVYFSFLDETHKHSKSVLKSSLSLIQSVKTNEKKIFDSLFELYLHERNDINVARRVLLIKIYQGEVNNWNHQNVF